MDTATAATTIRLGVMDYAEKNDTYISNAEKAARTLIGDDVFVELAEARKALPKRDDDPEAFVAGNTVVKARIQELAEQVSR
ncbi:hypothetical protein [Nocardioides sp. BYT-33-1]|uniref:hypothetical protein n=1 Tax=Nocardioides sp. BYT-33-1 TaxID=3416952 RepID=UPI003F52F8E4